MMPTKLVTLCLFVFLTQFAWAQKPPTSDTEYEKTHERRIRQKVLFGVYIPKDLGECFVQLNRLAPPDGKAKFMALPESQIPQRAFYGLGRWIVHNWGFYGGSRLTVYLNDLGLHHPEDMANFILIAYHRNLHKNKLEIKSLLTMLKEKREEILKEEKLRGAVIHTEKRQRPKPVEENKEN